VWVCVAGPQDQGGGHKRQAIRDKEASVGGKGRGKGKRGEARDGSKDEVGE